jgi:putative tryptophan/tyrosine transport system substrate-binding protein
MVRLWAKTARPILAVMDPWNRRDFLRASLGLTGLGLLAGCGVLPSQGRAPADPRRIGFLDAGANPGVYFDAFHEGLRDLGYVEGQHVLIERRDAEGDLGRLSAMAAELVALPVDVIVVSGSPAVLAASQATSTIPIVTAGTNVVGNGLVKNMARPEGNITGVGSNASETFGKWVELLHETVPTISRLAAVQGSGGNPTAQQGQIERVERAAQPLGLQLAWYEMPHLDQLSAVLSTARAEGAEGLIMLSGGVIGGGTDPRIGGAVLKSGLPAVAENRLFAANGGLLAHGIDSPGVARRAAGYVDRILKGARPGDLPIELPTTFRIVVNLRVARELGVTVPQSVLLRATELIQ